MTAFADLLRTPGVEERSVRRSPVGFLAIHGGLEGATVEITEAAAERADASWYAVVQPDGVRDHVPSHQIGPADSAVLDRFLAHCEIVVSAHGFGRDGFWTSLLLGGADRDLAGALAATLRPALPGYEVVDDVAAIPTDLRGLDPRNPVNRTRSGGVQLELPPRVRGMGPAREAVRSADGFTADAAALVDALAAFARERG